MKPVKDSVAWCTPGELRKLSHLASQFILNRVAPGGRARVRRRTKAPRPFGTQ